MKKSDCETGLVVRVRKSNGYEFPYPATIRALNAEDVYLSWSQEARQNANDFNLPTSVGYPEVYKDETHGPGPATPAAYPTDQWTAWGDLWQRLEKVLEARRELAKELRAALPLSTPVTTNSDSIVALPGNLVSDLGLDDLLHRTIKLREQLAEIKTDAVILLQQMYDQLSS